jgi:hypothetical protein
MKKLFLLVFVLAAFVVSVLLLLPVFFNADEIVKPYVEKAITKNLDADAKIGHLSLSLWGKLAVHIQGIEITDKKTGAVVFKVADAALEAPLAPLFDKFLNVSFVAHEPQVKLVMEKSGKLNLVRMMRSSPQAGAQASSSSSGSSALKGYRVAVTTKILDADISYRDQAKGTETKFRNLDFIVSDFSLTEPFGYSLAAHLDGAVPGWTITGPAVLDGTMQIQSKGGAFEGISTTAKASLDKMSIKGASFQKSAGEPLNFGVVGTVTTTSAHLKIASNVESLAAKTTVNVKRFSPLDVSLEINAPKLDFEKLFKLNLKLTDVYASVHATPSTVEVKDSRFKVFKGGYSGSLVMNMAGGSNKLAMKGKVAGIDVNEAITSQMPEFKDTLVGNLDSDYHITTSGRSSEEYKKNLAGSGFLTLKNGSWSALYALKRIGEKLSAIPGAKDKIGDLKVGDKIQTGKSNFKIANQNIVLSNTVLDMKDSRATVTGGGNVGFNKQMRFSGFLLAPLGNPPAALRNSDGRAKIPFEIAGAVNGPSPDWNVTTNAVAKAYLKQEGEKMLNQVKDRIKDENVKKIIEKAAPGGLDKLLKDIKL